MEEEKSAEEPQEKQEAQETEQPQKKSFPTNIIIVCILGICLLGGGLFVWRSGLLSGLFEKDKASPSNLEVEGTKQSIGPIFSLDTFIVNLISGRGKDYLKAKIDLELNNEAVTAEINKRLPQFRDAILTMLSSKAYEDIKSLEGKFQLRAEIMSMLNQHLKTGKIENIYFTDFIVQ